MQEFDVGIVGGGPAGLQAALMAGRACLRVALIDAGEARNATTHAAHSFPTRDGIDPLELRRVAAEPLGQYDVTRFAPRSVASAGGVNGAFDLYLDNGEHLRVRKVILATGVRDILPDVPGMQALWGRGVFHCPYCDGWEVRNRPLALMMRDERIPEAIRHFRSWSRDLTIVPLPGQSLPAEARRVGGEFGVRVVDEPVRALAASSRGVRVDLESGDAVEVAALFVQVHQAPRTELARQLGCEVVGDGPIPGLLRVDGFGRTTVEGVLAAGDVTTAMQQAWIASTAGGLAAIMAHRDLMLEGFPFDNG